MIASTDSIRQQQQHGIGRVKVLHAYQAQHDDELTIQPGRKVFFLLIDAWWWKIVGDVIVLLDRRSDQWCKGSLNGRIGLFPGNFAQDI